MPLNAPAEYWKAKEKYNKAKTKEEKINALKELLSKCPNHKGAQNVRAQWKKTLSKLKKKSSKSSGGHKGIQKKGTAQVCLVGPPNSGKSTLLKGITNARPQIATYPYTTQKPEIGTMNYKGAKIQLVEIPSTMEPEWLSIAKTSDGVVFVYREEKDKKKVDDMKNLNKRHIFVNANDDHIKTKIWNMLNLILVYPENKKSPLALKPKSTVKEFALKIHKDMIKHFKYAKVTRVEHNKKRVKNVGLDYILKDGDMVEINTS